MNNPVVKAGVVFFLGLFAFVIVLNAGRKLGILEDPNNLFPVTAITEATQQKKITERGKVGKIKAEKGLLFAFSEDACVEMIDFINAKNNDAVSQMIGAGRLDLIHDDTRVTMLDPGFIVDAVRPLDGPHYGKTCYLPAGLVME